MRISTAQYYEITAANYQRNFNKAIATSNEASSLTPVSYTHLTLPTNREV